MKGKKLLFAVNLTLIACLVLSPLSVFAQSEEPNPPPVTETTVVEAPAEENVVESAGDAPVTDTSAPSDTPETVTPADPPAVPDTSSEEQPSENNETQSEADIQETQEGETVELQAAELNMEENLPAADSALTAQAQEAEDTAADETPDLNTDEEEVKVDVELDLSQGSVTINDDGEGSELINITGKDTAGNEVKQSAANNSVIRVTQSAETEEKQNVISIILGKAKSFVTVILDKLNINLSKKTPITVNTAADSTVALELDGENKVAATGSNKEDISAIKKTGEGTLVIQNESGDESSLTATATKTYGAAIGGGKSGNAGTIVIDGATVIATKTGNANYSAGAAIGAGAYSNVDEIRIENGANVTATLGSGIGSGGNTSGAAIGAGTGATAGVSGNVGSITISNSKVTATAHGQGAAIGGGQFGTVESITIKNSSEVTAEATFTNAAIGGGTGKAKEESSLGGVGSIDISNSTVEATQNNGAKNNAGAIGAGLNSTVGSITIHNADVTAKGNKVAIKGELKEENVTSVEITEGTIAEGKVSETAFTTVAKSRPFPTADPTPEPKPVVVPEQPKEEDKEEELPPVPVIPTPAAPIEEKTVELIESKKDDDAQQSNIVIEGTTAKITVTNETGEQVDPHEVTIKSVAAFEETGAAEASIQLTAKLVVDIDVAVMKEAAAQSETDDDAVTVTHEDSVITVKSGETALVSVDIKEVVTAVEETVTVKFTQNTVRVICGETAYYIDLTDLGDVGTLTLRLENGVLKIYDKAGNLIKEVVKA